MPKIYLSPSTQDWNMYVTGSGSEEYNMTLLADALVPYLLSNGIQYQRNRPEMTAGSSIREANQGEYDLYLAASPGFPLYCWRSATTTITATPPGWRATGMPSPSRLPGA